MTTLRDLIDAVETAQQERDLAGEQMRLADERLNLAKDVLIQAMQEQGTETVSSPSVVYSIKTKNRPRIVDYDAFTKFVLRSGNIQLFQRRLMEKAFDEITEERGGKPIPGTDVFEQTVLDSKPRKSK